MMNAASIVQLRRRARRAVHELAEELSSRGTTEALAAWIAFASRFHRFSAANVALIRFQRPTATRVAGRRAWNRLGREVRVGEEAIGVLAPSRRAGGRLAYVIVPVYDEAQTEGDPMPVHPAIVSADVSSADALRIERVVSSVCPVVIGPVPAGLLGCTDGKVICVAPGQTGGGRATTLLHEAAHVVLQHLSADESSDHVHGIRELEAEAVAVAVTAAFGYSFARFSACYLATFGVTSDDLRASVPRVHAATRVVLDRLREVDRTGAAGRPTAATSGRAG